MYTYICKIYFLLLNHGQHVFLFFLKFILLFLKKNFIYLFIYFWLHWVFTAVRRLSLAAACGLLIAVASLCGTVWALGTRASAVVACGLSSCGSWALGHRLSSCGAWA